MPLLREFAKIDGIDCPTRPLSPAYCAPYPVYYGGYYPHYYRQYYYYANPYRYGTGAITIIGTTMMMIRKRF
jgi:hypothetical protein